MKGGNLLILIMSALVGVILMLLTAFLIYKRQPEKQADELLRLSETSVTAVLGGMLIVLGFFVLYQKFNNPNLAGNDENTYLIIGAFALISVALGCGVLLYSFLKKIIAYQDKVVLITFLGQYKEMYWKEITEVKASILSNKATLSGNNCKITLGGEPKKYKEFLKIAKKKIRPEISSDVFERLLNRSLF